MAVGFKIVHVQHFFVKPLSPIRFLALVALVFLSMEAVLPRSFAEVVAEWKFDSSADVSGGSVVPMDHFRSGASNEAILRENSRVVGTATGLKGKWSPILSSGYLETGAGGGIEASANKDGLVTQAPPPNARTACYSAYFGFSGLGDGSWQDGALKGGTVYLVLSPREVFHQGMRYGFMGTGHASEGAIQLGITKSGDLQLSVGGKEIGNATATVARTWDPGTWYFIAASWRANAEPVLYVREMGADGPSASPEALVGTTSGVGPPPARPGGAPLVIGANWYDPGARASTVQGSGSRIAYVRFDNIFSTKEEMEAVFKSLAAP